MKPRFTCRWFSLSLSPSVSLVAVAALGLAACGSTAETKLDAGSGSGGNKTSGSGGAVGSGGATSGSGGATSGSGGATSGSGGATSGSGGATSGSGGAPSGSGGATSGSGGATSGSGGATSGSGGAASGSGGATSGSGGATSGAGGATSGSGGAVGSGGASTSSGGASSSGGATGAGGAAGASAGFAPCKFASGVNVAWVNFANDVPNPNISTFNTLFKNVHDAGGRVVRWWFHTNGTKTPTFTNGVVSGLGQDAIDGVKSILASAASNGVRVNISLWSFDMLQGNTPAAQLTSNQNLLMMDANRQAYIDKALVPLVKALAGNPGLYAYEIFNEPEGMSSQYGWTTGSKIDEMYVQKTVNWFAAAIHDADPAALVTNGAWTFQACSTGIANMQNYYSDSALRAVGGKMNGTLDFYEVHYYTGNGQQYSPFRNAATHWGLDKKLVIGEFYTLANDGVAGPDTYTHLYDDGYNGAWAWQYLNEDGPSSSNMNGMSTKWPAMQIPMQNVSAAHADVTMCP